jgi:predicted MFS family arabinose efflux permease
VRAVRGVAPHHRPTRRSTFGLLGLLEGGKYLVINFLHVALVAVLRAEGASLGQIAGVSAAAMLFAAKPLWAPLLDRFGARSGRYRSWLLVVQPLLVAAAVALVWVEPSTTYAGVVVLVVVLVQLVAVQDVVADALAIRALTPSDRPLGSGVRAAGGYLGHVVGAGALLYVYTQWGWTVAIVALAACTALPLWPLARFTEPPEPERTAGQVGYRTMLTLFRQPGVLRWALFLLPLSWISATGAYALATPMLVDAGWPLDRIGFVVGVVGSLAGVLAAVLSGALLRRLGRRRGLVLLTGSQAVPVLAMLPLAAGAAPLHPTMLVLCAFCAVYAGLSVAFTVVSMDLSRPASAASDFTVLSGIAVVTSMAGGPAALAAAAHLGYAPVLATTAVVALAAAAANALFLPRVPTRGGPAVRRCDLTRNRRG